MTRELSPKAGASLLKKTFAAKGAKITHTEALDLLAKLKGYEAWSHLQKASGGKKKPTGPVTLPLVDLLRAHYGNWGDCPRFPREDWQYEASNNDTSQGYWEWVAAKAVEESLAYEAYVPPAPTEVTLPDGKKSQWQIEVDLSDRWGEPNYHAAERKPGLALLELDAPLMESLQDLMVGETTFISRKDGHFGLLFEVEYASRESERQFFEGTGESEETIAQALEQYSPQATVVAALLNGLKSLEKRFKLEMCVPHESAIVCNRPAVWAFMPLAKPLSPDDREALAAALSEL